MAMPVPAAQQPFDPAVCGLCGRILERNPRVLKPPDGSDLIGPIASSDPSICLYCETVLTTGLGQAPEENDLLKFFHALEALKSEAQTASPSLIIIKSRRELRLPATSLVYLGRRDEANATYPHIDLTDEGAGKYGVSRMHARIHQYEHGHFIEDLGSTNGTFINGQRLSPSRLYPLDHGDMLHLGKLKLAVTFSQEMPTPHQIASDQIENRVQPRRTDAAVGLGQ